MIATVNPHHNMRIETELKPIDIPPHHARLHRFSEYEDLMQ